MQPQGTSSLPGSPTGQVQKLYQDNKWLIQKFSNESRCWSINKCKALPTLSESASRAMRAPYSLRERAGFRGCSHREVGARASAQKPFPPMASGQTMISSQMEDGWVLHLLPSDCLFRLQNNSSCWHDQPSLLEGSWRHFYKREMRWQRGKRRPAPPTVTLCPECD